MTYPHSMTGQASIPLAYIVRENDIPVQNIIYPTMHDQLVECAILHDAEYNTNNGIVYDLLQSLTLNGPAWTWVNGFQRTRDGRGAWKALSAYYKGDSMRTRNKQECNDAIVKAVYQGNKRNFDFNSYVMIHQQAHQDLIRLGEPIPENKKVRDFLHGITDPRCDNIRLNVLANKIFLNDFAQAINYISSAIDLTTKNTTTNARQISDYHRNMAQNTTQGGRGQGRGRGGYQGRQARGFGHGRGRGRGRGRGHENSITVEDNRLITRGYSNEEWQSLSTAQRNRIYRERDRLETARTVAAMVSEQITASGNDNGAQPFATADDVSTITASAHTPANQQ
jgi:hypothetical protein